MYSKIIIRKEKTHGLLPGSYLHKRKIYRSYNYFSMSKQKLQRQFFIGIMKAKNYRSLFSVARCHTNLSMDTFLSESTAHNHAPNPERIPVIELSNQIKAHAAISDEPTSVILHSALRTFPLSPTNELPGTEMIIQTIRRQRQASSTPSDNGLPEDLKTTGRGVGFLLHEDKYMTIFTTGSNLSALKQSKHWFAGGSFKVCH